MRAKSLKPLPPAPANQPAAVTMKVATAMRALRDGTADPDQQRICLDWILSGAAAKGRFPYHATERDTAFALGRYFVAEQIVGLFYVDMDTLRRGEDEHTVS